MTHNINNSLLNAPLFDNQELSLIKLLVLESLANYDSISEANCKGNMYGLLKQTLSKVHELQSEL